MDSLTFTELEAAVVAIGEGSYVSFEELAAATGRRVSSIPRFKLQIEEAIRLQDDRLRLTSRMDLAPPGFEVEE